MHLTGEGLDPLFCVFDLVTKFGIWSQCRVAQPVVTYHPLLVRISDPPSFQVSHRPKRFCAERARSLEEIIRKIHSTDVDGEADVFVTKKVLLESLPQG